MQKLFEFEVKHWKFFETDVEEYSLRHTQLHNEYLDLFEEALKSFHVAKRLNISQFYLMLKEQLETQVAENGEATAAERLLSMFLRAQNFVSWAEYMKESADKNRRFYDVD